MAARSAERRTAAEAEDYLRDQADDPHAGHHEHLDGSAVYCSCGKFFGVTSVVVPDLSTPEAQRDWDSRACGACGQQGVVGPLGEPDGHRA